MKIKIVIAIFISAAVAVLFATAGKAQSPVEHVVKVSTDTASNADTVIVQIDGMGSKLNSITATVKKVSGTVAGYVLLQGRTDNTNWQDLNTDTLSNTNQSINIKTWTFTATNYYDYRLLYKTTGTQKSTLTLSYLRRQDD